MKVIDDGTKKLTAWNRNYFFVVTVFVAALCITLHACLGNDWTLHIGPYEQDSRGFMIYKGSRMIIFLNCFAHANWQHCLLNMLCFFICGCWLERREGSLKFSVILFITIIVTSLAVTAGWDTHWAGYSGVNYGLYAYTVIDFIFSLQPSKRSLFNIIGGSVMMALIYFAMCFNGGTTSFGFEWYPYDLIYNYAHRAGFLVMLPVSVLLQTFLYLRNKNKFAS